MGIGGLTIADLPFLATITNELQVKVGQFTWNMANADGSSQVTGVGFTPQAMFCFTNAANTCSASWGTHYGLNLSDNFSNNPGQKQNASGSGWVYDAGGCTYFYISLNLADGFTVSYSKSGSPTSILACNYIALARKNVPLQVYGSQITRDLSLGNASVAYTGFGFLPKFAFLYMCNNGGIGASLGMTDGSAQQTILDYAGGTNGLRYRAGNLAYVNTSASASGVATLSSFDPDGCTLAWTSSGGATATLYGCILALR